MSEDAKTKLMRDIDSANNKLQRDTEDAQADLDEEQEKIMQDLGNKMMAVIEKYAQPNGFAGARRQQSADSRAVGRRSHRYHRRDREALRSGQPGDRCGVQPQPRRPSRPDSAAPPRPPALQPSLPPAREEEVDVQSGQEFRPALLPSIRRYNSGQRGGS